jgi:hypothetical protein
VLQLCSSVSQYNWPGNSLDSVRTFKSILINRDVLHFSTFLLKSVFDILHVVVCHMEFVLKDMEGFTLAV